MDFTGYRKIASTCPISIGMAVEFRPNLIPNLDTAV